MIAISKRISRIIAKSLKRLYVENYSYHASALSFITLLAIVPIVADGIYIFSFFPSFKDFIDYFENYLYSNFLPDIALAVKDYLHGFLLQAGHLPILSIIFSFVSGLFLLLTIEWVFNSIYHRTEHYKSLFWKLLSWTLATLIIIVVGLFSFISSTLILINFHNFPLFLINFIINTFLIGTLYVYIPNITIRWRDGILGGAISALLFEIGRKIFKYYVVYLANYNNIYGKLSLIPIFLLWIYISWLFILFGAMFVCEKNKMKSSK